MAAPSADDLAQVDLFRDLSPQEREQVASWFDAADVDTGRRLTREEAYGYAFSVLAAGSAEVTVEGRRVRTLGPGDYFGEISLLFGREQTATITATSPCRVWRMFGADFRQLQERYPKIAAEIESTGAQRRATSSGG